MAKTRRKKKMSLSRIFRTFFLSVALIFILGAVLYGVVMSNKTSAESINQGIVLDKISQHLVLPKGEPNSLRRVSDAKDLKEEEFYKDLKNGDYIIVYDHLVIIYDFDKELIKNIKTR